MLEFCVGGISSAKAIHMAIGAVLAFCIPPTPGAVVHFWDLAQNGTLVVEGMPVTVTTIEEEQGIIFPVTPASYDMFEAWVKACDLLGKCRDGVESTRVRYFPNFDYNGDGLVGGNDFATFRNLYRRGELDLNDYKHFGRKFGWTVCENFQYVRNPANCVPQPAGL